MTLASTITKAEEEGTGDVFPSVTPWNANQIALAEELINLEPGTGKKAVFLKLIQVFESSVDFWPIKICKKKNYLLIPKQRIMVQARGKREFPSFKVAKTENSLFFSGYFSAKHDPWTCTVTDGKNWKIWEVSNLHQEFPVSGIRREYALEDPEKSLNFIQEYVLKNPIGRRILREDLSRKYEKADKEDPRRNKIICFADTREQIFTDIMDLWNVSQEDRKKILNENSTEQEIVDRTLWLVEIFRTLNNRFGSKEAADKWFLKKEESPLSPLPSGLSPFEYITQSQEDRFNLVLTHYGNSA